MVIGSIIATTNTTAANMQTQPAGTQLNWTQAILPMMNIASITFSNDVMTTARQDLVTNATGGGYVQLNCPGYMMTSISLNLTTGNMATDVTCSAPSKFC